MEEIDPFQPVENTSTPKIKRRSFNLLTKKRLLEEAQNSSLTSFCKTHGIARGSMQLWKRQAEEIKNSSGLLTFLSLTYLDKKRQLFFFTNTERIGAEAKCG
jgi:hypothetical protein